jgi:hypothetical protein
MIDEGYGRYTPCEALVGQRVKGREQGSINETGVNAMGAQPTYRSAASSRGRQVKPLPQIVRIETRRAIERAAFRSVVAWCYGDSGWSPFG